MIKVKFIQKADDHEKIHLVQQPREEKVPYGLSLRKIEAKGQLSERGFLPPNHEDNQLL